MLRFDRVTTPRLVLRRWQPGDLDSFAALNSDPEVMRYFPSTYDRSATAAMITAWEAKIDRQGFGLWAVERAEDGTLLGMAGLNPVPPGIITGEGLEIGWRLARHAWGHGYATEAGRAAVDVARRIGAQSVWSFTSVGNERSQAVMRRLGLSFVRYFDHPNIPDGQSTRPHVLYQLDLAGLSPGPSTNSSPDDRGQRARKGSTLGRPRATSGPFSGAGGLGVRRARKAIRPQLKLHTELGLRRNSGGRKGAPQTGGGPMIQWHRSAATAIDADRRVRSG